MSLAVIVSQTDTHEMPNAQIKTKTSLEYGTSYNKLIVHAGFNEFVSFVSIPKSRLLYGQQQQPLASSRASPIIINRFCL